MPDAAQIIEPQKPDSASACPDAQQASIAGKILEQEFIECQQQADLQRNGVFIGGFVVPTEAHRYPQHQIRDATCGMVSMLAYWHTAVNDNYRRCWIERNRRLVTVKLNSCEIILPTRPATFDFTRMRVVVKLRNYVGHPPRDDVKGSEYSALSSRENPKTPQQSPHLAVVSSTPGVIQHASTQPGLSSGSHCGTYQRARRLSWPKTNPPSARIRGVNAQCRRARSIAAHTVRGLVKNFPSRATEGMGSVRVKRLWGRRGRLTTRYRG